MIKLSGLTIKNTKNSDGDIEVKTIGLRSGEKLYEELLCNGENTLETDNEHIKISKHNEEIDYDVFLDNYNSLIETYKYLNQIEIKDRLKQLVPEYKISYKIFENNIEQTFNVHTSYKQQLKSYQKKHFDPFSRGCRIPYFINDTCIITTIGQLNFFKWAIENSVIDYIDQNYSIICPNMGRFHHKLSKHSRVTTTELPRLTASSFVNYFQNLRQS